MPGSCLLLMTLLALFVAVYAAAAAFGARNSFVQGLFTRTPAAALGHLAGGTTAIAVGAFHVNRTLRNRFLAAHRWMGRLYVLGFTVGAVSALALAIRSDPVCGPHAHASVW